MRPTSRNKLSIRLLEISIAIILVLIPFHATLTVWLSSIFGHYTILRLWKEGLLAIMFVIALRLAYQNKKLWDWLKHSWLQRLFIVYLLLHLILGVVALSRHEVTYEAFGYALIINLRLMVFFWICLVASVHSNLLKKNWQKLLLIPAAVVVAFALPQHFLLPADFLRHFGYNSRTILPYDTIDQNNQYVRVQSTLRGPNPLGAYLVIIITALSVLFLRARLNSRRAVLALYGLASVIVLYYTYSRSAWAAVALAVGLILWIVAIKGSARWVAGIIVLLILIVGGGIFIKERHSARFESTILHTSPQIKTQQTSNGNHLSAVEIGLGDVIHQPQGRGPGTAGPASSYNTTHNPRIAENYYVQLGQEVGVLGASIFIAINIIIARVLWNRRSDSLALILLCSLAGISLVNMLSHAWTDDTLAYVWWGLAGIAVAPVILKAKEHSAHETQKTQKKTAL